MDLASEISKLPRAAKEKIVDAFGNQCDHQQKVDDGQVHHKHICRGPQGRRTAQNLKHHPMSANSNNALISKVFLELS